LERDAAYGFADTRPHFVTPPRKENSTHTLTNRGTEAAGSATGTVAAPQPQYVILSVSGDAKILLRAPIPSPTPPIRRFEIKMNSAKKFKSHVPGRTYPGGPAPPNRTWDSLLHVRFGGAGGPLAGIWTLANGLVAPIGGSELPGKKGIAGCAQGTRVHIRQALLSSWTTRQYLHGCRGPEGDTVFPPVLSVYYPSTLPPPWPRLPRHPPQRPSRRRRPAGRPGRISENVRHRLFDFRSLLLGARMPFFLRHFPRHLISQSVEILKDIFIYPSHSRVP